MNIIFSHLLFFFFFFFFFIVIDFIFHYSSSPPLAAAATHQYYSSLDLSQGINLSVPHSYNFSSMLNSGIPTGFPKDSEDLMFKLGIPTVDAGGIFFPILSSPLFNRTHPSQSTGFSLGFYFVPVGLTDDQFGKSTRPCINNGCHIYMAVCAGSSGYSSRSVTGSLQQHLINPLSNYIPMILLDGAVDANNPDVSIATYQSVDGFVVPVWIANMARPIRYANSASLITELVQYSSKGGSSSSSSSSMELQLRDGDEVVWNVSNVGMMEIHDTGEFLIYSSPSRTEDPVWQSSSTDTLVYGHKWTKGMELISNDSAYMARVEKGGLALYLNKLSFNLQAQPPYWIFPALRNLSTKAGVQYTTADEGFNQLVSSAPCSGSSVYLTLNVTAGAPCSLLMNSSCGFTSGFSAHFPSTLDFPWGFLRMENDGRLYMYAVDNTVNTAASATRFALDMSDKWFNYNEFVEYDDSQLWGQCDVPMACGPFGVCTPYSTTICSCPEQQSSSPSFEQVNTTDMSQGCQTRTPLPTCMSSTAGAAGTNIAEHVDNNTSNIDFVELASTATIFNFNRWNFIPTKNGSVDACKKSCFSNCMCKGFIYHGPASACFFITDGITLLHFRNTTLYFNDYDTIGGPDINQRVLATDYVTYLKVVSATYKATVSATYKATSKASTATVLKIVIPSLVACLVLGCTWYFLSAWKNKRAHMILRAREEEYLHDILPLLPSRFSYKDLHQATRGFTELLGAGGCGSVYAGVLFDGRKVAVKVLKVFLQGAPDQQSKQFLAEVASVGRTNHQNIVRLLGFCWEVSERLLVYEYVERGALDRWLFMGESANMTAPLLDWQTRYNVALGIARGLHYLHEECEPPILHFDIKPQNILLDDAFVAKLADFGLSRLMQRDMSSVVTGVRGTPGYIAPEWSSRGSVSKKSDVYSMGMVLLKLVGGRRILDTQLLLNKNVDSMDKLEAFYFPSWAAKKCEEGSVMELVDKRLRAVDCEQAQRLVHIAFSCIHEDPIVRPNVRTVLSWLEGSSYIEVPLSSFALYAGRH